MILLDDGIEVNCNKPSCPIKDNCIHYDNQISDNVWYRWFGKTNESCEHFKNK